MADRLSLTQLRRLGDLKEAGRAASLAEFLHRVRSLRDREILAVTSSAAAICAARLAVIATPDLIRGTQSGPAVAAAGWLRRFAPRNDDGAAL